MISSVSNSYSMNRIVQQPNQQLTDSQKETVNSILSNYDSSNMTKTDFESMRTEFEDAGIRPSEDLKGIMEDAGFELPKGPGPKGVNGEGKTRPPEFSKLMEKLGDSDVSEEEILSFIETLQNENGKFSGTILDELA